MFDWFTDLFGSGIDAHRAGGLDDGFQDSGPSVNIDGSPMVNGVDIHGNPFGVTSEDSLANDLDDSLCCFDEDDFMRSD